jgi:DNA-binding NarL/FixJ family response regulator
MKQGVPSVKSRPDRLRGHMRKPVILIVEDHDELRHSLQDWLRSFFHGCNVLQAKSGEEAVQKAGAESPDIVLMDIILPKMNGIEAASHIKGLVPGVQILMLSMYEDSAYQSDAGAAGAIGYIPKRRMGAELIPAITKLLCETVKK